jgi:hypothetical protein
MNFKGEGTIKTCKIISGHAFKILRMETTNFFMHMYSFIYYVIVYSKFKFMLNHTSVPPLLANNVQTNLVI